jgi:hypothetical protein
LCYQYFLIISYKFINFIQLNQLLLLVEDKEILKDDYISPKEFEFGVLILKNNKSIDKMLIDNTEYQLREK